MKLDNKQNSTMNTLHKLISSEFFHFLMIITFAFLGYLLHLHTIDTLNQNKKNKILDSIEENNYTNEIKEKMELSTFIDNTLLTHINKNILLPRKISIEEAVHIQYLDDIQSITYTDNSIFINKTLEKDFNKLLLKASSEQYSRVDEVIKL
jgi:uncharacterized protein (DUF2235 family)